MRGLISLLNILFLQILKLYSCLTHSFLHCSRSACSSRPSCNALDHDQPASDLWNSSCSIFKCLRPTLVHTCDHQCSVTIYICGSIEYPGQRPKDLNSSSAVEIIILLRDFRFSLPYCWRFKPSLMLHSVDW